MCSSHHHQCLCQQTHCWISSPTCHTGCLPHVLLQGSAHCGDHRPRLPAGLQVQGLPKRQDKRRLSNKRAPEWEQPILMEGLSILPDARGTGGRLTQEPAPGFR